MSQVSELEKKASRADRFGDLRDAEMRVKLLGGRLGNARRWGRAAEADDLKVQVDAARAEAAAIKRELGLTA
jgi:hypothetical protein